MFASVYENPWDVDVFPGGIVELPVKGGLVGPTFACIIGQTFRNLRRADRFWFENAGQFTTAQLRALRNTTLARIICDTDIFETALRRAKAKCHESQLETSRVNLRNVLGPCLFEIGFPTLTNTQFTEAMESNAILTPEEALAIYQYIGSDDLKKLNYTGSQLPLKIKARAGVATLSLNPKWVIFDMAQNSMIIYGPHFNCNGSYNNHKFKSYSPIAIHGFGFLGPIGADRFYDVSVTVQEPKTYKFLCNVSTNIWTPKEKLFYLILDDLIHLQSLKEWMDPNNIGFKLKAFGLRLLKTGFYSGYNETSDCTVPSAFAAAAFRFGHSLVQPHLHRCDEAHREMPYKVDLSQELMIPSNLHNLGEVDRISLGLASQRAQRRDEFITSQLTNHLFRTQGHKGLDLAAINIQRGRDHGLPPYLRWREACGLMKPLLNNKSLETWDDFGQATGISPEKVEMFASVYENSWDVDLFPGGMVELPVKGGLVGPTFACIIGQTFRNLRRADRFWFENPGQFTTAQLRALRNTTLARIICDTSDSIRTIQPIIFLAPHLNKNPHASCTDGKAMPFVSLDAWEQHYVNGTEDPGRYDPLETSEPAEEPSFYSMADFSQFSQGALTLSSDDYANEALENFDFNKFRTFAK